MESVTYTLIPYRIYTDTRINTTQVELSELQLYQLNMIASTFNEAQTHLDTLTHMRIRNHVHRYTHAHTQLETERMALFNQQ